MFLTEDKFVYFQTDDTSLSGITITQLSLVSHQWQLEATKSMVPGQ